MGNNPNSEVKPLGEPVELGGSPPVAGEGIPETIWRLDNKFSEQITLIF